jgi:hypothetical protein
VIKLFLQPKIEIGDDSAIYPLRENEPTVNFSNDFVSASVDYAGLAAFWAISTRLLHDGSNRALSAKFAEPSAGGSTFSICNKNDLVGTMASTLSTLTP